MSDFTLAKKSYRALLNQKLILPPPKCVCGKTLRRQIIDVDDTPAGHILKYSNLVFVSRRTKDGSCRVSYWTGRYVGAAPVSDFQDVHVNAPNTTGLFCGVRCSGVRDVRDAAWAKTREQIWLEIQKVCPGINYPPGKITGSNWWNSWVLQKLFFKIQQVSVVEIFLTLTAVGGEKLPERVASRHKDYVEGSDPTPYLEALSKTTEGPWYSGITTAVGVVRPKQHLAQGLLEIKKGNFYPTGTFTDEFLAQLEKEKANAPVQN